NGGTMTEKQSTKKKAPKGLPRPYETIDTVRHGSALAEIVRYQSPLGSVHHVYRPKRIWESMTTTKEDTSELIFPNTTGDLIRVAELAQKYCQELDSGQACHRERVG